MKNNFLGYIFIIIIMVVVGFSIYKVKVKNSKRCTEVQIQFRLHQIQK